MDQIKKKFTKFHFKKASLQAFKKVTPKVEVAKTTVITDDLADDDMDDEDEDDVFSNTSKARFLDIDGENGDDDDDDGNDDGSIDEDDLIA